MKPKKRKGRKAFFTGVHYLREDTNDYETSLPLKPAQERAWLGDNSVHFEKYRRPHRWHHND